MEAGRGEAHRGADDLADPAAPAWDTVHSAMTPAGEIEAWGRLSRGMRSAGGWRRRIGYVFVAVILAPIVIIVLAWLVTLARQLL